MSTEAKSAGLNLDLVVAVAAVTVCLAMALNTWLVPLVLAIALICFLLARPDTLFYGLAAGMPIVVWLPTETPIRDLMAVVRLAALLGVLVDRLSSGKSIRNWILGPRLNWVIIAYCAVAAASLVHSHDITETAQKSIFRFASYIALYFAFTGWIETEHQIRTVCRLLLWSTVATALFGFYQLAVGDYTSIYMYLYGFDENRMPWSGRITSFLNYSNSLAGYLNLVIPLGIGFAATKADACLRRVGLLAVVLGSSAMVFTESRGGLIALALTLLMALWIFVENTRTRLTLTVLFLMSVPFVLTALRNYSERFGDIDPDAGRLIIWNAAWDMFLSHPFLGIGYGNFRESFDPTKGLDAHNLYLQMLAETGVVGCILFIALCTALIVIAAKQLRVSQSELRRSLSFALLAAVVSVLVHGTVDYLFNISSQFSGAFWLMLALMCSLLKIQPDHPRATRGTH